MFMSQNYPYIHHLHIVLPGNTQVTLLPSMGKILRVGGVYEGILGCIIH